MTNDPPVNLWADPEALGLMTDLYQLAMMVGYCASGIARKPATFELFVRRLPPGRSFLVFAGLEQVIGDLSRMTLRPEQVEALRTLPNFAHIDPSALESLIGMRFRVDLWSV